MLTRSKSFKIQLTVLKLMKRFYFDVMPFEWKHILEDTIITCLENISEIGNIQKHKQASLLYFNLINLPKNNKTQNFIEKLENNTKIEIFKYNPFYSSYFSIDLIDHEGMKPYESIDHFKSEASGIGGFLQELEIKPRSRHTEYLYASKGKSLLYISFQT